MRATVYTEDNFFELGVLAKNAFLKCLPPDENGEYDTVQIMTDEIRSNVEKLTDKDFGMEWQKKFSYIKKFKKLFNKTENGKKFMVNDDFTGVPMRIDAVKELNKGKTLKEVNELMKKWYYEKKNVEVRRLTGDCR